MKYRLFAISLVFCIFLSFSVSALVETMDIEISLNNDRTADWVVLLNYSEFVERSDYFIFSDVNRVSVYADSSKIQCETLSEELGTSIICNGIDAKIVEYNFRAYEMTSKLENLLFFDYRFSITQLTNRASIQINLPIGTALVEEEKIAKTGFHRFEPIWGIEGTDGRKIFVRWIFEDPKLADTYNVYVLYEGLFSITDPIILSLIGVIAAIVIVFFFYHRHSKKSMRNVLPVLTEGERKVMLMLMRDKEVDQREIVREIDYSKAKVSRIIQNLISRGLVEKEPKGRKNLIRLKKK